LSLGQEAKHQAKCLRIKSRELGDAQAKHLSSRQGLRVLNALYYAHQPNCRFNSDVNASHCRRLTWALGFSQTRAIVPPNASTQYSSGKSMKALAAIFLYAGFFGLLLSWLWKVVRRRPVQNNSDQSSSSPVPDHAAQLTHDAHPSIGHTNDEPDNPTE
jgi:hypothetical protein